MDQHCLAAFCMRLAMLKINRKSLKLYNKK
jgi:hypothetical protein